MDLISRSHIWNTQYHWSMQGYLWRVFFFGIIPIIMSMTLIQEVGEALVLLFSFFCNNTP